VSSSLRIRGRAKQGFASAIRASEGLDGCSREGSADGFGSFAAGFSICDLVNCSFHFSAQPLGEEYDEEREK